jgi:hypothetical protein
MENRILTNKNQSHQIKMPQSKIDHSVLNGIKPEVKSIAKNLTSIPEIVSHFPIGIFPVKLQQIIRNVVDSQGINESYFCGALLFAYSLALGKNYKLQLKKGQSIKAVLYLALVGRPGSNKSASLEFMMGIFREIEAKYEHEYQALYNEYKQWEETPKGDRSEAYKEAPQPKEFYLTDSTFEDVFFRLKHNKRGLAIYKDELAGFFKDLDKYNKSGNKENLLTMWSGIAVKVGRKTQNRIFIPDPFLGICGSTQPTVLTALSREFLKGGEGLIDRFLFVYPDNQEKPLYTDNELDIGLYKSLKESITSLVELPEKLDENNEIISEIISYQEDARKEMFEWLNFVNKPRIDNSSDIMAGIYTKFDNYIQRINLIIHFIKWSFGESEGKEKINLDTVQKSIKVVDFFISHTLKVQNLVNQVDAKNTLEGVDLELYQELPEEFRIKDVKGIFLQIKGIKDRAVYDWFNKYDFLFKEKGKGLYQKIKK